MATTTTTTTKIFQTTLQTINSPSQSDLDTFVDLVSTSYLNHPLTRSFITETDSTPPPYPSPSIDTSRLKSHFSPGVTEVSHSNVLLTFAYPRSTNDNTSSQQQPLAAALFEPPSFTSRPSSSSSDHAPPGPILTSYRALARTWKTKHLSIPSSGPHSYDTPAAPSQSSANPSEDPFPGDFNKDVGAEIRGFYHLAFLARGSEDEEMSAVAVKELVAEYQGRAGGEELPIWATVGEEWEMRELVGLGFRVVDEGVVGEGVVDGDGWPAKEEDAAGVRVWAVMWEA